MVKRLMEKSTQFPRQQHITTTFIINMAHTLMVTTTQNEITIWRLKTIKNTTIKP